MRFIGLLSLIATVGIPIGIVVLIVRAVGRRRGTVSTATSGESVRRFFTYAVLGGLVSIVAVAVADLLALALPDPDLLVSSTTEILARSIAFLAIGVPALVALAWWIRRLFDEDPAERDSVAWAAYGTVISVLALALAVSALITTVRQWAGLDDFDPTALADAVVWTGVWAAHWVLMARTVSERRSVPHLVIGSAIGLTVAFVGLVGLVRLGLAGIYGSLFESVLAESATRDLWAYGIPFVIGGAVWWRYWWSRGVRCERTAMWHAYVLLYAVLGGLVTAVVAASTMLFAVLQWFFGDPVEASAVRHFDGLPLMITLVVGGFGLWRYHRNVLGPSQSAGRKEIDRVYEYVVAAVGLLAALSGLTVVFVALIEALAPAGIAERSSPADTLIAAVTMLVVGIPLWWRFWSAAQRSAESSTTETASPTRRGYLTSLFGIGGITAIISLIVGLFTVLRDILDGDFSVETIRDIRVAIALVVTVGAVAAYHWTVFRADRTRLPAKAVPRFAEIVLVNTVDGLSARIAEHTGARVTAWHRLDDGMPPLLEQEVIDALAGVPDTVDHRKVLVLASHGDVEVIPYAD